MEIFNAKVYKNFKSRETNVKYLPKTFPERIKEI
jgi:hypothetical protein